MRAFAPLTTLSLAAVLALAGFGRASTQEGAPVYAPNACGAVIGAPVCGPQEATPCDPACGETIEEFCHNTMGCWTFSADALALQRDNTRKQPLFVSRNDANLLDAGDLHFSVEPGFELSAIHHGPCGWQLEARYFQIDGWEANGGVDGVAAIVTDKNGGEFLVNDGHARYTSRVHLGELNLRREWCDGLTLLAGFRMGELDELYSASGTGYFIPVTDSLNINTFNHLYGFQVGADWEFYNMGGPLRISALCKAGAYANYAIQSVRELDPTTTPTDNTLSARHTQAAFIGETGLTATYQVNCHLSFRAVLQAVWIEGVALAPEQIGATDFIGGTADIDTHGGIFYYGGGLGAEYKF